MPKVKFLKKLNIFKRFSIHIKKKLILQFSFEVICFWEKLGLILFKYLFKIAYYVMKFNVFDFFLHSRGCIEGCYCPDGYYENNKHECVKKEECPCTHNGMLYAYGQTRKEDCNTW